MLSPEGKAIMEVAMKFAVSQIEGMQEPWARERADAFVSKITTILSAPPDSENGTASTCETAGREKGGSDVPSA